MCLRHSLAVSLCLHPAVRLGEWELQSTAAAAHSGITMCAYKRFSLGYMLITAVSSRAQVQTGNCVYVPADEVTAGAGGGNVVHTTAAGVSREVVLAPAGAGGKRGKRGRTPPSAGGGGGAGGVGAASKRRAEPGGQLQLAGAAAAAAAGAAAVPAAPAAASSRWLPVSAAAAAADAAARGLSRPGFGAPVDIRNLLPGQVMIFNATFLELSDENGFGSVAQSNGPLALCGLANQSAPCAPCLSLQCIGPHDVPPTQWNPGHIQRAWGAFLEASAHRQLVRASRTGASRARPRC